MTLWTIQSMEFSRPEYWSGLPFPSQGDRPDPGLPRCRRILYQLSHKGSPRDNRVYTPSVPCCAWLLSRVRLFGTPWGPCSSVHGDSLAQNARVGSPSLLQGSFPTQESNWGLLHRSWILYSLSPREAQTQ